MTGFDLAPMRAYGRGWLAGAAYVATFVELCSRWESKALAAMQLAGFTPTASRIMFDIALTETKLGTPHHEDPYYLRALAARNLCRTISRCLENLKSSQTFE